MTKIIITPEQLEIAKVLIDKFTYEAVAKKLNVNCRSMKYRLKKIGVYKNKLITCLNCNKEVKKNEFINGKRVVRKKFCDNSCSAIYSNKNRERKKKEKCSCLNCGELCNKKYCSQDCQFRHKDKLLIEKIKNNDTNGLSSFLIKKALISIHGEKCMKCGWDERHPITGKVPIELNHKDGNSENNKNENVELLCPNCHSLTPNYKALNKGNGRHKRRQRIKEGKSY